MCCSPVWEVFGTFKQVSLVWLVRVLVCSESYQQKNNNNKKLKLKFLKKWNLTKKGQQNKDQMLWVIS